MDNSFNHRDSIVFPTGLSNRIFDHHHMYMDNTNFMNIKKKDNNKIEREDLRFPISLANVQPINFNDSNNNHIPLNFTDRDSIPTRNIPIKDEIIQNKIQNNNFSEINIIKPHNNDNEKKTWDNKLNDFEDIKNNDEKYFMNKNINKYVENKPMGTRLQNQDNQQFSSIGLIPNRTLAIPKENIR
jgi:hypothetical protein